MSAATRRKGAPLTSATSAAGSPDVTSPGAPASRADATAQAASGAPVAQAPAWGDLEGLAHLLTCGSVDDGKSTLIGRLLWDASDLPEDTRQNLLKSAGPDGEPDVSLLLDGLVAEREQGITIDIAWRYFDAGRRRFVVIDSPGHEQYTRNMASGASHADVAIMLVDARHGVKRQTRRHAAILDLVGVKQVILAVNKMDLAGWSEAKFREIEADFATVTGNFSFQKALAMPVSAKLGDNIARRSAHLDWYKGPTLLDELARVPSRGASASGAFRMPVQLVLRGERDFRGLAGTISGGRVKVGDAVQDALSGRQAHVRRIATMDGDLPAASIGQAVVLQLDTDIDVARGGVLAAPDALPVVARELDVRLVWLSDAPLEAANGLLLRTATDLVPIAAFKVKARLDLETLAQNDAQTCAANDIVIADIRLGRPTALDPFSLQHETGSFVLVDALTGGTLAGGIVKAARASTTASDGTTFKLTAAMLAGGLCAGLQPEDAEFQRRANEVAILLRAAGVTVEIG